MPITRIEVMPTMEAARLFYTGGWWYQEAPELPGREPFAALTKAGTNITWLVTGKFPELDFI